MSKIHAYDDLRDNHWDEDSSNWVAYDEENMM